MNTSRKTIAALAAVTGLGLLTFGGATLPSATAQGVPGMARHDGDRDRDDRRPRAERHPEIRIALRQLQEAKASLQRGSHDFSGHREKALDLTQQAINQCQQALRDDKN